MFPEHYQPSVNRMAPFFHDHVASSDAEPRGTFQTLPINLSPEEIRALVRDVLG